jgi:hypothetical protein
MAAISGRNAAPPLALPASQLATALALDLDLGRALGRALGLALALALGGGCGADTPTLLDDPLAPWPDRLSAIGLYPDLADPATVAVDVIGYAPRDPFWSNGAVKDRFIAASMPVDISARDRWSFPAGTLLFKTLRFPSSAQPTETRVLRRVDDRWDYAVYRWRADEAEADLLAMVEPEPVAVTVDGVALDHLIPSRLDCRTCHESAATAVLGFDELGLGADQLRALRDAGVLVGEVPADPAEIVGSSDLEREVLGYLEGNCAHCHNGGDAPSSAFDLRHRAALASLICQPTNASQTAAGLRVVPGDPSSSVMFLAVSGESDDPEIKAMPPIGVQHRDAAGIALLRAWIEALPGACDP